MINLGWHNGESESIEDGVDFREGCEGYLPGE
jgi:hypothetical protein